VNEKSIKGDHYIRKEDLGAFVERVERLRREGLSTRAVAQRLGVSVSTLNCRLRKYRA
jgi:Trp operon repressor